MKSKSIFNLLLIVFSLSILACEKKSESNYFADEIKVDFCSLTTSPEKYQTEIIQTNAIALGYHTFIFYSADCLEQNNVIALDIGYEDRRKLIETIGVRKTDYKTSFLNNNLYGQISVVGELKKNNEKAESSVFHPKYKFFVSKIKDANILSEEIFPNEDARGLNKIK